jgi:hypothetical protein
VVTTTTPSDIQSVTKGGETMTELTELTTHELISQHAAVLPEREALGR